MRWLLIKDLQILRRSPLLVGLLVVYPIAIALMIGFALSSPPGKPKVAFYDEVPPGKGKISIGNQQLNVAGYALGPARAPSSRSRSIRRRRRSPPSATAGRWRR